MLLSLGKRLIALLTLKINRDKQTSHLINNHNQGKFIEINPQCIKLDEHCGLNCHLILFC